MKNILVAIDFEEQDRVIIDIAVKLADSFDSKIWLIHIAAPDPDFVGFEVGPQYIRDSRAVELKEEHKKLQDYVTEFQKKGLKAEALLVQGATIKMIIQEAKKLEVDLIITGHHDRNFIYRALFVNVSKSIISKSKIPVMIIPID